MHIRPPYSQLLLCIHVLVWYAVGKWWPHTIRRYVGYLAWRVSFGAHVKQSTYIYIRNCVYVIPHTNCAFDKLHRRARCRVSMRHFDVTYLCVCVNTCNVSSILNAHSLGGWLAEHRQQPHTAQCMLSVRSVAHNRSPPRRSM